MWPTPKQKTEFHKALETAFPVYDPLFPKAFVKPFQLPQESGEEEGEPKNVPDNWEQQLDEPEEAIPPDEAADILPAAPVKEPEEEEDRIVLGPGGQWGLPPLMMHQERATSVTAASEGANGTTDPLAPKVAAWSLPTTSQPWQFSELTHHGRRKQKALHRKNKKKNGGTSTADDGYAAPFDLLG